MNKECLYVGSGEKMQDEVGEPATSEDVEVMLQARLAKQRPDLLKRAAEIRREVGDPVTALVELFSKMPGDDASWREILDEPYG